MTDPSGHRVFARPRTLTRRQLLGAGASAFFLAACGPEQRPLTVTPPVPTGSATVSELMGAQEITIAHRGSYDNFAEHTMDAYQRSVEAGALAIEVSVNATSDGVLVCHHDKDTTRWADKTVTIADTTYAELEAILVDPRAWLGPSAKLQPIPKLQDVLDAFAGSRVIFLEDKQGTNTEALLDLMDRYPDGKEHFVWKQWAGAGQYAAAKQRGYRRWGYYTLDILDQLDEYADRFDYLGVPSEATDDQVKQVVKVGKPVIAWEVHTRSMLERLRGLGVQGVMCSNIPYVTGTKALATTDSFSTGLRAAGDLPWTTSKGVTYQPAFDVLTSSITVAQQGVQSYSMGSMCPVERTTYTLSVDLRWPDDLPERNQHAGLAFGMADDRAYRVLVESEVAGYHVIIRPNGSVELYSRPAGEVSGTRLGQVATADPEAGEWVSIQVLVSPERILVSRKGPSTWRFEVEDASYRGGYFSLCKNYPTEVPVQFREISVSDA